MKKLTIYCIVLILLYIFLPRYDKIEISEVNASERK